MGLLLLSTFNDLVTAGDGVPRGAILSTFAALTLTVLCGRLGAVSLVALLAASLLWGFASSMVVPSLLGAGLVAYVSPWPRAILFAGSLAVWILAAAAGGTLKGAGVFGSYIPILVGVVAMAQWLRRLREARRKDQVAIRELEESTRRAAADERRQMAGELHDVVAHHLTMLVMLSTMGGQLDDARRMQETFARMEETSRRSLTDLRLLFGVLERSGATKTESTVQATTEEGLGAVLDRLVGDLVLLGFSVAGTQRGDLSRVPGGMRHALRRSMQEMSSNIVKYADPGSRVEVSLVVDAGHVALESANAVETADCRDERRPAAAGALTGGTGLVHLREQAEALGGRFSAGRDAGGWRVRLELPLAPGRRPRIEA